MGHDGNGLGPGNGLQSACFRTSRNPTSNPRGWRMSSKRFPINFPKPVNGYIHSSPVVHFKPGWALSPSFGSLSIVFGGKWFFPPIQLSNSAHAVARRLA